MFFSNEIGIELTFFGPWHLLQIAITILVVYLIYRYRNTLHASAYETRIRYVAASILILLEVSIHVWNISNGEWTWQHSLPLDLCAINIYGAIILFFTKNRALFNIIYFWGFGALLSVLFPDIPFGPDRYRYYQFFYAHMMFLWIYMYMIFVHDYRPTVKQFLISCGVLFVLAIGIVLPINILLGENYMFVLASDGTPLELIEGFGQFVYTAGTVVVIFLVASIWYAPIYLYLKRSGKLSLSMEQSE